MKGFEVRLREKERRFGSVKVDFIAFRDLFEAVGGRLVTAIEAVMALL